MNINTQTKTINVVFILTLSLFLFSCAGKTMIQKRDLEVSNRMSSSIFLTPRPPEEKVVYLEVRNTSDKSFHIKERIEQKIRNSGYQITSNPNEANYILQANILQVAKADLRSSSSMLEAGFGGALLGAGASSLVSSSSNDFRNASIIGAGISLAMDALVEDINFTVITDLQIKERVQSGEIVNQGYQSTLSQGNSSSFTQSSSTSSEWKTYQTRILSTANMVNLEFTQAGPALEEGLANSIGGIF